MLKNLVFQNPGFEPEKYRSIMICNLVTANTCTDDNNYSPQPTGFWTGATYKVLSGLSAGKTGTIVSSTKNPSSCSGCGQIIKFDQNVLAAVGDYFVMTQNFPGNGDAGWWDSTAGGGTITSETTDLSSETPGTQAVAMNASASGQSASLTQYWDSDQGLSFIQMNGNFAVTFRAKGIGGSKKLSVGVERLGGTTVLNYLQQTVALTGGWADYTLTFSANETGSANGTAQLVFSVAGSSVELDDVSLAQTNSSSSNPTAFRDDVVTALQELQPGSIRMMAGDAALGSDLVNQIQVPFARYREGWSTGGTATNVIAYGIHEFLGLCAQVGADPWITVPTATTPAEMQAFIQYLTGTGSDQYSALRISRGQSAPWTSVFNKIHLELGNETWNGSFRGESMNYYAYPGYANQIFGSARSTSGYVASKFDLVLDGFTSAGYDGVLLATSTQHDSIDMAPYLLYSANNEPISTIFGALYAEPEMWTNVGGGVYNVAAAVKAAPKSTYLSVYETNLGTMEGSITQPLLNQLTPSVGGGLGHTVHMLEMMRLGVRYQNAFALPQYEFLRSDGLLAKLWGIVRDMGTTNLRRPQFLTQSLANSVIGGNMLQTTQTGGNPTWNQPLSSDNVVLNGAHYLQSFAFQNGNSVATVIFNLNLTTALPVTFSGPNAPSGSIQMTQITSANITDNNESSSVVLPKSQTLSGFNPGKGLTLPPFSMTVLTSNSSTVQAPAFSIAAGTYTSAQSVSITDGTSGAKIYYTTNGTTPSTSSSVYSAPITVSGNETLEAIAVASGLTQSPVSTASYVISASSSAVATPTFSPAGGTYSGSQKVTIADGTSGTTIYYTTNGTGPTSSSAAYTGAITVSASETIKAIAIKSGLPSSAEGKATYTIASSPATPTFSPAGGTYSSSQKVTIADTSSGVKIYYTTNGSGPTSSSAVYTGPITVSASETIKAIAIESGLPASTEGKATYTISATPVAPTFSPASGTYSGKQTVTISEATSGSTIYYQINGTGSVLKYSGPVTVSATETIHAAALGSNNVTGPTTIASYTINASANVASPTFSLASGTYTGTQKVTISDATSGATIYYQLNGTGTAVKYGGPLSISSTTTVSAAAVGSNYAKSAMVSAKYTIETATETPSVSVATGTYTSVQTVTLADKTPGAVLYYTTNGTVPTKSSARYAGPIRVSSNLTLRVIAIAPGKLASATVEKVYAIKLPVSAPVVSLASGTYSAVETVTIADATRDSIIYYTTNGATPTTKSARYSGPIRVSSSLTVRAIATAENMTNSAIVEKVYTIKLPVSAPVVSLASGTYSAVQTVTITDATRGAVIYYTTNGTTPTTKSARYSGPIRVSSSLKILAMAAATDFTNSAVVEKAYTIKLPTSGSTEAAGQ